MSNKDNGMDEALAFLDRFIHPITLFAGGIALVGLTLTIVTAVIFRYVFNSPIFGKVEKGTSKIGKPFCMILFASPILLILNIGISGKFFFMKLKEEKRIMVNSSFRANQAFVVISGPMPVGSPHVIAIGLFIDI